MKGHNWGICRTCGKKHTHPRGMLGKTASEETKKKQSDALKGSKSPMYGLTGKNHPWFGKKHSDETRRRWKRRATRNRFCGMTRMYEVKGEYILSYRLPAWMRQTLANAGIPHMFILEELTREQTSIFNTVCILKELVDKGLLEVHYDPKKDKEPHFSRTNISLLPLGNKGHGGR